jgi:hypothetical protein
MAVFFKERLAFLSMLKTGTTAYQTALAPHADLVINDPPLLKHAPVYRYNRFIRPMFHNVCDAEMELINVMRKPVSWLSSWYRYRQRPFMKDKPNNTIGISFDEFVLAYKKGKRPGFAEVGNQLKFLEDRLEVKLRLERENVSPTFAAVLSSDVEERFRRNFSEDFALYDSISKTNVAGC